MSKPSSILRRLEWPAELNAFLKSRSTQISLVSCFIACLRKDPVFFVNGGNLSNNARKTPILCIHP